jgi:DnaJ like chaperone protein
VILIEKGNVNVDWNAIRAEYIGGGTSYRKLAKKYHPDILRANGLSDEAIQKATEAMSQVNAAWSLIEKARRL